MSCIPSFPIPLRNKSGGRCVGAPRGLPMAHDGPCMKTHEKEKREEQKLASALGFRASIHNRRPHLNLSSPRALRPRLPPPRSTLHAPSPALLSSLPAPVATPPAPHPRPITEGRAPRAQSQSNPPLRGRPSPAPCPGLRFAPRSTDGVRARASREPETGASSTAPPQSRAKPHGPGSQGNRGRGARRKLGACPPRSHAGRSPLPDDAFGRDVQRVQGAHGGRVLEHLRHLQARAEQLQDVSVVSGGGRGGWRCRGGP